MVSLAIPLYRAVLHSPSASVSLYCVYDALRGEESVGSELTITEQHDARGMMVPLSNSRGPSYEWFNVQVRMIDDTPGSGDGVDIDTSSDVGKGRKKKKRSGLKQKGMRKVGTDMTGALMLKDALFNQERRRRRRTPPRTSQSASVNIHSTQDMPFMVDFREGFACDLRWCAAINLSSIYQDCDAYDLAAEVVNQFVI
ncbi:Transcription factor Tfc4/TFIIIC-102/Sfc4 like protein [Aduncisulcus paluster]|uniref:Transcription factor Tfc4/TFIIIC-102/Sfc4 like protein n=2 Tax=Aduncisulcus paluster TaxID=2918883 RepID=A0ABQ5KJ92_9EUKA|nr:Transcription factor Tfc4/TFIIIC-102/Sfc4 like protein [Aduncisulcus paluster]